MSFASLSGARIPHIPAAAPPPPPSGPAVITLANFEGSAYTSTGAFTTNLVSTDSGIGIVNGSMGSWTVAGDTGYGQAISLPVDVIMLGVEPLTLSGPGITVEFLFKVVSGTNSSLSVQVDPNGFGYIEAGILSHVNWPGPGAGMYFPGSGRVSVTEDVWHRWQMVIDGQLATWRVDGVTVHTATDEFYVPNVFTFFSMFSTAGTSPNIGVHFDNLRISDGVQNATDYTPTGPLS